EAGEAVLVAREMRWHPVENDADAVPVERVDEVHEVLRRAVPRGGREISRGLVAPGSVKGMFRDRQQLDVRVAGTLDGIDEATGELGIGQALSVRSALPGAEVDLIDGERGVERHAAGSRAHPFRVIPVVIETPSARRRARRNFPGKGKRIALVRAVP